MDQQALLNIAVAAAQSAGNHAFSNIDRRHEVMETFDHDVKLQLDRESQTVAEQTIMESCPDHRILGEEGTVEGDQSGYEWIIDPIDGTVNFTHGLPLWCSSVAVRKDGKMLAGAVYMPAMQECYTATADGPALCNGDQIQPSGCPSLDQALIVTGLTKNIREGSPTFSRFSILSLRAQKVRIMGAAAVDICHVACGRADAYLESGIYIWDVAAAGLIAERAGAVTEVLEQWENHRLRYLCSSPAIHEELKEIFLSTMNDIID